MNTLPAKPGSQAPTLIEAGDPLDNTPYNVHVDGVKKFKITPAQWVFVQEYLATSNAGAAYAKAFNCLPEEARAGGKKLLRRPEVMEVITSLMTEYGRRAGITLDAIRAQLWLEGINPESKAGERIKALETLLKADKHIDNPADKAQGGTTQAPIVNVTIVGGEAEVSVEHEGQKQVLDVRAPSVHLLNADDEDDLDTPIEGP